MIALLTSVAACEKLDINIFILGIGGIGIRSHGNLFTMLKFGKGISVKMLCVCYNS